MRARGRSRNRPPIPADWLEELAAGYLLQFRVVPERRRALWGYSFTRAGGKGRAGIFVGFLTREPNWARGPFAPAFNPPECVVFAFVEPAEGRLHQRWVRAPGSLFRSSYELLTKYTARPPRWEFREAQGPALVRRVALAEFPPRERAKYARNFFMETLAILVRSGLPERLAQANSLQ
ncbi:hypothetical protein MYX77_04350 [Acidobacteriia bacterium AH_259_A11_L15]|nr:hypothetical protein [Acidobacteriia bacterium AH_259_A11_L15]